MNYQDYEYGSDTDTDTAPWTVTPTPSSAQMVAAARPIPVVAAQPASSPSEMMVLASMLQSVQQNQTRQLYLLRDFDMRLSRVEVSVQQPPAPAPTPTFERTTWWAIWGLLMLILGGALAVVLVLILLNVQWR